MMRFRHAILASAVLCPAATVSPHVEGGKVFSVNKDGSGVVRVSAGTGNVTGPAWNPDGSQILYVATGAGHGMHDYEDSRLSIVTPARPGDAAHRVAPGSAGSAVPGLETGRHPGRLHRQAGDIGRHRAQRSLPLTNLADGTTANLTNGSVPFIGMPVWSSGGDRIALTAGIGNEWNLLVMEADGRSPPDTVMNREYPILNLSWSADGSRFALQCLLEGNFEICVLNADRQRLRQPQHPPWLRQRSGLEPGRHRDRLRVESRREPGDLSHGRRWIGGEAGDGRRGQRTWSRPGPPMAGRSASYRTATRNRKRQSRSWQDIEGWRAPADGAGHGSRTSR